VGQQSERPAHQLNLNQWDGATRLEMPMNGPWNQYLDSRAKGLTLGPDRAYALVFIFQMPRLSRHDAWVWRRLREWGYEVRLVGGATARATDADGMDVVCISETVASVNVGARFRAAPQPVVCWEAFLFDDMQLTGPMGGDVDFGTVGSDQDAIEIIDPAHPLAAGLSAGIVTVYDENERVRLGFGRLGGMGAGAQTVATTPGNTDRAVLFTYEQGSALAGGGTAAGSRVGFFWHKEGGANLTPEGAALFDAAIRHADQDDPGGRALLVVNEGHLNGATGVQALGLVANADHDDPDHVRVFVLDNHDNEIRFSNSVFDPASGMATGQSLKTTRRRAL